MTQKVKVTINQPALEIAITRRNLSRKMLAYEMGVSRFYLSHVLNGKVEPSAAIRQRLLDLFKGYKFDDLFTIEGDDNGRSRKK